MFALRGPEFLALFAGLAVVVYFAVDALIAAREARIPSQMRIRDPYAIAYLRGDSRELVRVVALSLGLRGLLQVGKATFKTVDAAEIDRVQIPVEKEVLRLCQTFCAPPALVKSPEFQAAVDEYHRDLVARGLLADEDVRNARWLPIFGGIVLLGAIALSKIWFALSTGHPNIVFLVLLAGVAGFVLILRALGRRTLAGNTALSNLKTLFASLRSRA
ncbi:MAG: hypothetical protein QOI59_3731, partial [Gammaproteobacteria bacterium]|nr:hypothetical protein [Gammaproteobacteria bacterium]